ncbi:MULTISPECIES: cation:proton antiporter [unclassified Sphingomonas]|uniref:cation:proton antiporter n=1 Tax=unclassified Sphingomonas TaxID=196159 RepID=UPI0006F78908|nr:MULTISPECIES: cation:proton antiporter [unclassified Sphingomonas]KQX17666.1 sodium:proton exchanger [Sphingomonas sp. Root1294]KQY70592.1 sodium:proton exchanger [Sphingomonas sp. Root50]KRB91918.1 sodium:proton exchanger [Sphingomonas sp. Root720]
MTDFGLGEMGLILVVASLVAMLSRRIGLPYTAGLVAAGWILALLPAGVDLPLSPELIFNVFLPPLIFEAALQLDWRRFRIQLPVTLTLAFVGVPISAVAVAAGMHHFAGWSWLGAAFFGVLIAATDPVSVIAAFKELAVEARLATAVEAESLLNDGVAAVGFGILAGVAGGEHVQPLKLAGEILWTSGGGIVIGAGIAAVLLFIAGRTDDHLVETTLTTVIAWGAFLIAERLGASGVFAALSAGLITGNFDRGALSAAGRPRIIGFWEYAAFLANSCLFILVGGHEAHQPINLFSSALAIAVIVVIGGRMMSVYALAALFRNTALRLPPAHQHILVWGGLRGAVGLALALALPVGVPERGAIIVVTFGVVAFSIFVQGLTVPRLLRRWELTEAAAPGHQSEGSED